MADYARQPSLAASGSRSGSLEGGLNRSPRSSSRTTLAQPAPLTSTPSIWFSAPDLRLARAAEAESTEPESQAQQRARAKFFDEHTSTDLRRWWFPVFLSEELRKGAVLGATLLGDPIVLWRDGEGTAVCLEDKCAHRSTPLSLGRIVEGQLECAYDGWRYDSEGNVTKIPALLPDRDIPTNACARRYPTVETDGMLWVWPGDPTLPAYDIHARFPPILSPGSAFALRAAVSKKVARGSDEGDSLDANANANASKKNLDDSDDEGPRDSWGKVFTSVVDLDIDQSILLESFLDYTHLAYSHPTHMITHPPHPSPSPVQVEIKFLTDGPGVLANVIRPTTSETPVEVRFIPPCHVQICTDIKGHKFHQTIHCVPTQPGQTRVIYRHSRNYWNWVDWLPYVGTMYNSAWTKRVVEDYRLLKGMQERLRDGAKPWNAPIQADLLPRYYREWYKRCMVKPNTFFSTFAPAQPQPTLGAATALHPMSGALAATHATSSSSNITAQSAPAHQQLHHQHPAAALHTNPYGVTTTRPFTINAPQRYTLAHIPRPPPSQLGIIQAASAAAATAAVEATGGASRRGSIANLVGVTGVTGGAPGSRRGSMIVMPPVSVPSLHPSNRGVAA
ncbi:uncharacterized protein EV422DRAFT_527303 [Fimicolochytrium jonesii]|uniref:uncharacterized protein n=1 Tax=Fimicolochytrium jonesii TaxID=1396493 RepID=UPI0022FECD3D|nr:uncharacterized protein EV422DRAFT_527303 [Fimicolochytrium jonesii]KAI8821855.1 hypothetical protein EV422DRAFT_527303 [Fimicolochytrium jonesii]